MGIFKQKEEDNSKKYKNMLRRVFFFPAYNRELINVFGNSNHILSVFSDTVYTNQ